MIKTLISALQSGIEIAFLIALLSASFRGGAQKGLSLFMKWGALCLVVVSAGLTYSIIAFGNREAVDLAVSGIAVILAAGMLWWLSALLTQDPGETETPSRSVSALISMAALAVIAVPAMEVILALARELLRSDSLAGVEPATKIFPVLLALIVSGSAGTILYRVASRIERKWVIAATMAFVFVVSLGNTVTALQIMLVRGMIPLTDWIFRPVAFMVNYRGVLYYVLLAAMAGLMLVAFREWRWREPTRDLNPAQRRKIKADASRMKDLTIVVSLTLLFIVIGESAYAYFGNRPVQLSPATPVAAENGAVKISEESLAAGGLHRYVFTTSGNMPVHFLVTYKGSGLYGVGLDACDFCGVAGYRQDKDNVVCNRCNAAINKTTIGFPGGCNPIPLNYHFENHFVAIPMDDLEKAEKVFPR
ncbi:MAG: DUF2318 domain-containing protein [Chloroflexi bacterium]|nr:DUF2318 domain-containing protein [Chloroflexota bacterium]